MVKEIKIDKSMINISELAEKIRKNFKDDKKASIISTGNEIHTPTKPEDFVVMPEWWQNGTGTLGIPFGYYFMISGETDSGKTSCAIEAMKCAIDQGCYIILADTEKKTTKKRITSWGVDPEKIARIQPYCLEEMYDGIDMWWKAIKKNDPKSKILIIIDSLGNTPSRKELELPLDSDMQLGITAKINKRAIKRLEVQIAYEKIAMLVINQTIDNMTTHGKANAGGKMVSFASSLTYQTSRLKFLDKTEKGKIVRVGIRAKWTLTKNHLLGDMNRGKIIFLDITSDGIKLVDSKD